MPAMKQKLILSIIFGSLLLIIGKSFALQEKKQTPARIKIIQADELRFERRAGRDIRRLVGNVVLEHEEVRMYCDSANMTEIENSFEAFSNVKVNSGDTLFLYGDYLKYNGNIRLAEIFYNVRLLDDKTTLTTNQLNYNRNTGIAYYEQSGKVVDKQNELTSLRGYYMTSEKRVHFRKDVVLINPEYVMNSDTLVYHTKTGVANFFGPTTIEADETYIYCENGWYDTQNDKSQFNKNANIKNGEHDIRGDSLYYDRSIEAAKAFENVVIVDTVQNIILRGNYAEYYKNLGHTFITKTPLAIFIDKNDSLYLHSDTIRAIFNEDQEIELIKSYNKVKFYKSDLQGMCDSLIYKMNDSLIVMYREPILWTGENQLSADSVHVKTNGETIETLTLYQSAFIVNRSDSLQFNQVRGRTMTGYFNEGELDYIIVSGNAETIYYVKEEDGNLIGINKAVGSRMRIELEDNNIKKIFYFEKPDGTMFPEADLAEPERILRGFNWFEDKRPKEWTDIFKK